MEALDNNQETAAPEAPKAMKQKDAVQSFITEALAGRDTNGLNAKGSLTKEDRKVVRQRLFAGMRDGTIVLGSAMDDSKLNKYCSSLIHNCLK